MMNRIRRTIAPAFMIALSAAAVTGCSLLPKEPAPLAPPLVKPMDSDVRTVEVKLDTIEYAIHGTGTLESRSMTYVQLEEAGGIVDEVFVKAGDEVEAGDLLLQLEEENLQLDILKRRLDVLKKEKAYADLRSSDNELEQEIALLELHIATEELARLEKRLSDTRVYAPMSGIIAFDSGVEPGDRVAQYQVLYTIADPSDLWIAFSTPLESARSQVVVGSTALVELNDETYTGTVVQTPASAPFVDNDRLRQKYENTIFIMLEDMPEDASLGDWGDVKIVLHRKEDTIVLPNRALRQNFGRTYVQILEGESRREVDVQTGIQSQTEVEIVKGLEIGQLVVMP